jgi:hypothetical protein
MALRMLQEDDDEEEQAPTAAKKKVVAKADGRRGQKRVNYNVDAPESDNSEDEAAPVDKKMPGGKRLRRVVDDDSSEDEYAPKVDEVKASKKEEEDDGMTEASDSDDAAVVLGVVGVVGDSDDSDLAPSPKKKAKTTKPKTKAASKSAFGMMSSGGGGGGKKKATISSGGGGGAGAGSVSASKGAGSFGAMQSKVKATPTSAEDQHEWLAKMRDGKKRAPEDPEYDATTLYIPSAVLDGSAKKKGKPVLTPFERQYWSIKRNHMKTMHGTWVWNRNVGCFIGSHAWCRNNRAIQWHTSRASPLSPLPPCMTSQYGRLFFKKGKFYELYNGDAWEASRLFGFKVTDRVNMVSAFDISWWVGVTFERTPSRSTHWSAAASVVPQPTTPTHHTTYHIAPPFYTHQPEPGANMHLRSFCGLHGKHHHHQTGHGWFPRESTGQMVHEVYGGWIQGCSRDGTIHSVGPLDGWWQRHCAAGACARVHTGIALR